jgi:Mechanosensitive ion channel
MSAIGWWSEAEQAFVRAIKARATQIETFDRGGLIVRNSNLVSRVVKNWVHNDRVGRVVTATRTTIGVGRQKGTRAWQPKSQFTFRRIRNYRTTERIEHGTKVGRKKPFSETAGRSR